MDDVENVIKKLSDVSAMLFQMYRDETDKENINIRYDQFLAVDNALDLLKEQKETISAKEKAIKEYETVLRPDIDSMWIRYAIKKRGRYMESFKHGTANWVFGVIHAHWFSDKEMAEYFARITHGTVVEIVTAIKK